MADDDYAEFLSTVMAILSARKSPRILILIDNNPGFETISSSGNCVEHMGMLEVAKHMMQETMRENRNREMEQKILRESKQDLAAMQAAEKGKAN